MTSHIDLNADLGESFGHWRLGDDEAMLSVVTSANIACGFHAGDALTLQRTCASAVAGGVVVGAQVGYRDLAGFGRRRMDVPSDELTADVLYQIGALDGLCRVAGGRVAYVKPHGALYNTCVSDRRQAEAVIAAVSLWSRGVTSRYAVEPDSVGASPLAVVGLPGSELLTCAEEVGLPIVREAFADRAYTPEGHLVDRSLSGAVLTDPDQIAARMVSLVTTGEIAAIDGSALTIEADTICVHGDTPDAVAIARAVRAALAMAGVELAPFVSP